jgi:hypothetical protein
MKRITSFFIVCFSLTICFSQEDCPCCSEDHKKFDFWVGDWVVFDTTGTEVGENLIVKLENGCIINEHWIGAKGLSGRSYNYYDKSDSTWNQIWIDSNGGNLVLKGKSFGNMMILKSSLKKGTKVDWYFNKITWTSNSDGSVTQLWEIFDGQDNLLNTVFKGIYMRRISIE